MKIYQVDESPYDMVLGEYAAFEFDFADIGENDPSSYGSTLAYDATGVDVSSSVLSGLPYVNGAKIVSKKFTPATAQQYVLMQGAYIDGNLKYLVCVIPVTDAKYGK